MKFTFGIITDGKQDQSLFSVIYSIRRQHLPEYEIVIVGETRIEGDDIVGVPFDEHVKDKWITRKKNLITEKASHENIAYLHDYVTLCEGWYSGFLKYGDAFSLCMSRILNRDGSRYRDWTLWAFDNVANGVPKHECLLPYDETAFSKFMYFSGSYWVAKKSVMEEFPLDETLCWGEGEDVEWSKRVREKYPFSINAFSSVQLLKQKDRAFRPITETSLEILRGLI